jgi:hypothetical protein
LAGLILGGILAYLIIKFGIGSERPFRTIFGAIAGIPLSILACSYLSRFAFELAAFIGLGAQKQNEEVRIVDVMTKGKSWGYRAEAQAFPDGRTVYVFVTAEMYDQLQSTRPPLWCQAYSDDKLCFTLPVEHGRWGAIRAEVPALWDGGLSEYQQCRTPAYREARSQGYNT